MPPTLSETQFTLLQYLHEHTGVAGGRIGLDPQRVKRDLRVSLTCLAEDAASLTALGLAGMRYARTSADDIAPSTTCSAVWVTRKGQDFLKRLRRTPVIARAAAATP